jgi:hypothetical protein
MTHPKLFLIGFALGAAGLVLAQCVVAQTSSPSVAVKAMLAPTDSDIYCAGYFTHQELPKTLSVLGGPDSGLVYEYGTGDTVYLNKGKKMISAPGAQYMLVRPTKDMNSIEAFPGQSLLVSQMGTHYAEIARIQIQVVNADSSIAEILHACEPVLAGDLAIPLTARTAPLYKTAPPVDRFAPSSGKSTGVIAAFKDFREAAGGGDILYLNIGKKQGTQPGNYVRIFRTYLTASQKIIQDGTKNYLTDIGGTPVGRKLSPEEIDTLPRTVVGEAMILSVGEENSTGIITYSWQDIYPGDQIEIE